MTIVALYKYIDCFVDKLLALALVANHTTNYSVIIMIIIIIIIIIMLGPGQQSQKTLLY